MVKESLWRNLATRLDPEEEEEQRGREKTSSTLSSTDGDRHRDFRFEEFSSLESTRQT